MSEEVQGESCDDETGDYEEEIVGGAEVLEAGLYHLLLFQE